MNGGREVCITQSNEAERRVPTRSPNATQKFGEQKGKETIARVAHVAVQHTYILRKN